MEVETDHQIILIIYQKTKFFLYRIHLNNGYHLTVLAIISGYKAHSLINVENTHFSIRLCAAKQTNKPEHMFRMRNKQNFEITSQVLSKQMKIEMVFAATKIESIRYAYSASSQRCPNGVKWLLICKFV